MRLPISKPYRAFPELDGFTDGQCVGFMKRARRRHWVSSIVLSLAVVFVGMPVAFTGMSVGAAVIWRVGGGRARLASLGRMFRVHPDDLGTIGVALWVATCALAFALFAMWIRDRWLRSVMRKQLGLARCPACEYPLLGLTPREGRVTCPECGEGAALADLGLEPGDLIVTGGGGA